MNMRRMVTLEPILVGLACVVALVGLVGCQDEGSAGKEAMGTGAPEPMAPEAPVPHFDAKNFSQPTVIDNKWLPLAPGTQFVLEGEANRGEGIERHRVV